MNVRVLTVGKKAQQFIETKGGMQNRHSDCPGTEATAAHRRRGPTLYIARMAISTPTATPPPAPQGTMDLSDHLVGAADRALRALFAPAAAGRPVPGPAPAPLEEPERREVAALMRINHAGEIAAQGLYHGQALAARDPGVRQMLLEAGREETDHLAWCEARLAELGDRASRLDPFWYLGSFAIGLAAGIASDRASLGFVSETEAQVERHLDGHLERLPAADARSRAILTQMRDDEVLHGRQARDAGGVELPGPVKSLMRLTGRIMTTAARVI
ncbi:MAG: 2-nonaprenyl-3-methyl-6-methoxy,4-benzoquinol hydroxylase [Pseudomonadota bacterium]